MSGATEEINDLNALLAIARRPRSVKQSFAGTLDGLTFQIQMPAGPIKRAIVFVHNADDSEGNITLPACVVHGYQGSGAMDSDYPQNGPALNFNDYNAPPQAVVPGKDVIAVYDLEGAILWTFFFGVSGGVVSTNSNVQIFIQ